MENKSFVPSAFRAQPWALIRLDFYLFHLSFLRDIEESYFCCLGDKRYLMTWGADGQSVY